LQGVGHRSDERRLPVARPLACRATKASLPGRGPITAERTPFALSSAKRSLLPFSLLKIPSEMACRLVPSCTMKKSETPRLRNSPAFFSASALPGSAGI
jgi:hypothetical protein